MLWLQTAKTPVILRICAVSPESLLFVNAIVILFVFPGLFCAVSKNTACFCAGEIFFHDPDEIVLYGGFRLDQSCIEITDSLDSKFFNHVQRC